MIPWYQTWFDSDEYELVYKHRSEEEAIVLVETLIATLDQEPGRLLDMGCGRGRHAIPFAKRGYDVTGVDLSKRSIESARQRARKEGVDISFLVADMRDSLFVNRFATVVNLFTAFGFFDDEYDDQKAVGAMCKALIPGGYFVQDYLNATKVRANFVPRSESETGAVHVVQERAIVGQRVEKEITISQNGERYVFNESVRLYELEDFERMYQQAGLSLIRTMGNYDGSDWHEDCPRLILISSRVTT